MRSLPGFDTPKSATGAEPLSSLSGYCDGLLPGLPASACAEGST